MANNFRLKKTDVAAYQITKELLEESVFNDKPYPKGVMISSCEYHKERKEIRHWFGNYMHPNGLKSNITIGHWILTNDEGLTFNVLTDDEFKEMYQPL